MEHHSLKRGDNSQEEDAVLSFMKKINFGSLAESKFQKTIVIVGAGLAGVTLFKELGKLRTHRVILISKHVRHPLINYFHE